jgi:NDP-sugar pyrophosphorylase family protein
MSDHTARPLAGLDVLILAGGLGTRIRTVLGDTPKVLAPVHGRTFLDHLLDRLAMLGAARAVLSLGYLADKVVEHLQRHGAALPVGIVVEQQPLGTGGAVRLARPQLTSNPVLVMNGDTWLDTDYAAFLASHRAQARPVSILCVAVDDISRYGQVVIGSDGAVSRFAEKNTAQPGPGTISGGVYLLSQQALEHLDTVTGPSLERDFLEQLPAGTIHGFAASQARFIDIGTPETLPLAKDYIPRD